MYAVLKTGGKQYKVAPNDVIMVEKLVADAGTSIELNEVLMISSDSASTVGTPLIEGASVSAEVLEQKRGKKITVFKKKRRQNYRRTIGHRQELTVLRITDILAAGEKKKLVKAEPKVKAKPKIKAADTEE
jgi:large subunit ribosomal protein L21